jgi:GNAT superfamily N-acetyltransferase
MKLFLLNESNNELKSLEKRLKEEYGIDLYLYKRNNDTIKLDSLIVPKNQRKMGIGSRVLEEIINFADANDYRIVLTPGVKDKYQGTTSQKRLIKFYKRFGFVLNKGKKANYKISELMYRNPK